jgi:hypothetical protein
MDLKRFPLNTYKITPYHQEFYNVFLYNISGSIYIGMCDRNARNKSICGA